MAGAIRSLRGLTKITESNSTYESHKQFGFADGLEEWCCESRYIALRLCRRTSRLCIRESTGANTALR